MTNIICKIQDQDNDIEIGQCNISFHPNSQTSINEYSIGYRFKFNKYTKYDLNEYFIDILVKSSNLKYVRLRLEAISIQFKCFNRICQYNNNMALQYFQSDAIELLFPCENDGNYYLNTTNICPLFTTAVSFFSYKAEKTESQASWYVIIILIISCTFIAVVIFVSICRITHPDKKSLEIMIEQD
ncbi:hypothetical protein RF11_13009 [Thelohanellus kitauei]|uniref:Transmembrane protein n=1 Tax=Thelohanellus kitauei TaxID=669202 RepID=A0A0C2MRC8_THEKT|nr:hypothetical protein RF11_13009 [Thelohanellus kitauei]